MNSFQMPKKTAFSIESTNTQITSKWLFSSVAQNVLSDKRWRSHFFRTKWTSPQMFSKLNRIILQFQSIRRDFRKFRSSKISMFLFQIILRMLITHMTFQMRTLLASIVTKCTTIWFFSSVN